MAHSGHKYLSDPSMGSVIILSPIVVCKPGVLFKHFTRTSVLSWSIYCGYACCSNSSKWSFFSESNISYADTYINEKIAHFIIIEIESVFLQKNVRNLYPCANKIVRICSISSGVNSSSLLSSINLFKIAICSAESSTAWSCQPQQPPWWLLAVAVASEQQPCVVLLLSSELHPHVHPQQDILSYCILYKKSII